MSLTFYYAPNSTASVTEAVLTELGVPCTRVKLDISAGDTRKPEFLALNPNGRVPVIVHEGRPIWESAAITMYLGEIFGVDAGLYPAPGPGRGDAMKWIVWCNVNLAEAGGRLAASLPSDSEGAVQANSVDWVPPDQRSASAADRARSDLAGCLTILERALAGRPFLLGDYSLADTHLLGFVGWLGAMDVDMAPFLGVVQWLERCSERPALATLTAG
jgi:glutathione S-transferase